MSRLIIMRRRGRGLINGTTATRPELVYDHKKKSNGAKFSSSVMDKFEKSKAAASTDYRYQGSERRSLPWCTLPQTQVP